MCKRLSKRSRGLRGSNSSFEEGREIGIVPLVPLRGRETEGGIITTTLVIGEKTVWLSLSSHPGGRRGCWHREGVVRIYNQREL